MKSKAAPSTRKEKKLTKIGFKHFAAVQPASHASRFFGQLFRRLWPIRTFE